MGSLLTGVAILIRGHRQLLILIVPIAIFAVVTQLVGGTLLGRIAIAFFINLMVVLSLQIFTGNSGLLSFAHVGFMGIGAYVSAVLTMTPEAKAFAIPDLYPALVPVTLPFIPAVLIGGLVAAVVAAVVTFPIMRLREAASVISTFALLVIIQVILAHWHELTNGPRSLFGLQPYTDLPTAALWGVIFIVVAWVFRHSSIGLRLRASQDSEPAALTIGVNVVRLRWIAFIVSAFIAGFAGGLWAHFVTTFSPRAFYLIETFVAVTMLIVGGPRTVSGAVIGTVIVTAAFQGLRTIENQINLERLLPFQVVGVTEILLAVVLIVVLTVRPGGLIEEREIFSGPGGPLGPDADSAAKAPP
ncbi:MAG: branched-chain amino acid ABC transporter permease [Chloroflexota bacterium]